MTLLRIFRASITKSKFLAVFIFVFLAQLCNGQDKSSQMLAAANAFRSSNGKPPFIMDDLLTKACQQHAKDMAKFKRMTHTGSDGSNLSKRFSRTGYDWSQSAENVAKGQQSVAGVERAWEKSEGHRRNLLSNNLNFGGGYAVDSVGVPYWSQCFGKKKSDGRQSTNFIPTVNKRTPFRNINSRDQKWPTKYRRPARHYRARYSVKAKSTLRYQKRVPARILKSPKAGASIRKRYIVRRRLVGTRR